MLRFRGVSAGMERANLNGFAVCRAARVEVWRGQMVWGVAVLFVVGAVVFGEVKCESWLWGCGLSAVFAAFDVKNRKAKCKQIVLLYI